MQYNKLLINGNPQLPNHFQLFCYTINLTWLILLDFPLSFNHSINFHQPTICLQPNNLLRSINELDFPRLPPPTPVELNQLDINFAIQFSCKRYNIPEKDNIQILWAL